MTSRDYAMTGSDLSDLISTNVASFPLTAPKTPEPEVPELGGPELGGPERRRYRTIWISDVHLGTKGCNAELLIDFLDNTDGEVMYLVGDIIDGWRLKKKFYWPAAHNDIVWRITETRAGAERGWSTSPATTTRCSASSPGLNFGRIEIRRAAFHDTADGRRLMVLHGDEFDAVML